MTWEQGAKAYRNDVPAMKKRRRNDIGTVPQRYRIRQQNDVVTTLPCYLGGVSKDENKLIYVVKNVNVDDDDELNSI